MGNLIEGRFFLIVLFFWSVFAWGEEKSLIAYWSFDEGEGEIANDFSGNKNDIKIIRGQWVDGVIGKCLSLKKGSNLILPEPFCRFFVFSGDYSIELWVKHKNREPQVYISKWSGSGSASAWWIGYYEEKVQFGDYYEGGQARVKGQDIADGNWHYIVGVRNGKSKFILQRNYFCLCRNDI